MWTCIICLRNVGMIINRKINFVSLADRLNFQDFDGDSSVASCR